MYNIPGLSPKKDSGIVLIAFIFWFKK